MSGICDITSALSDRPSACASEFHQIVEYDRRQEHQRRTEEAADDAGHAADNHHRHRLDRYVEIKLFGRDGAVIAERQHRSGDPAQERAAPEGQELEAVGIDADDGGGEILLPHRRQRAAEAGAADIEHKRRDHEADGERHVIARAVVGDGDAEDAEGGRLQRGLTAAADRLHMRDDPVDEVLHGERADGEIEAFDAKRGEAENQPDRGAEESAKDDGDLERHAGADQMDGAIGADRHHRRIAEMDLAGPAHQQIEPERRRTPDDPRQQITGKIKVGQHEGRDQSQQQQHGDLHAVDRNRPQRAVGGIAGVADSGEAVKHRFTPARCLRGRTGRTGAPGW